jgi:thiol-disulfide isomerase/thioredoxin
VSRLWILVLACVATGLFASDEALPRYKLPAGRKLAYTVDADVKGRGASTLHGEWTLTVLGENCDGSVSVLADGIMVRNKTGEQYKTKGKSEDHHTFMFDVSARGKVVANDPVGEGFARALFFPLLPASVQDVDAGWLDGADTNRTKERDAAKFVFELNQPDPIYGISSVKTIEFDRSKELIVNVQREYSQTYGFEYTGTQTVRLTKDEQLMPAELDAARQFLTFAQASKQYDDTLEKIFEEPARCSELLAQAGAIMNDAAKKVSNVEVQKAFARAIEALPDEVKQYSDMADKLLKVLNKPAPEFSVSDFDGGTWTNQKLKGSVVVLDFWYRGCSWCMKAMPQIKEVVAEFKDKPVHIFGVNVDEKQEDGAFVINKMDLHYPQLKGKSLVEPFGVSGYPTLIVIDPEGAVRTFHFGFSPDLKEKLEKNIESLLGAPAGKREAAERL